MQTLSILALAALAAFIPHAHASGSKLVAMPQITDLVPDAQFNILKNLSEIELGIYAKVSPKSRLLVEKFRNFKFGAKVLNILVDLGVPMPKDVNMAIQSLAAARRNSADKQNISLGTIVQIAGIHILHGKPDVAKKLALLASASRTQATNDAEVNIVVSPRSLLQLAYATGKCKEIDDLLEKNAAVFKDGLGIDVSWTDGLLHWFLSKYLPNKPHSVIHVSGHDLSAIYCSAIYSDPNLPTKASKTPAILDFIKGVLFHMQLLTKWIHKHHSAYAMNPSLKTLLMHQTGPLVSTPEAFNINLGLETCLAQHPSPFEIISGLVSLLKKKAKVQFMKSRENMAIPLIIEYSLRIAGGGSADLWWITCSPWSNQLDIQHMLNVYFETVCPLDNLGHSDCINSMSYKSTPSHSILDWSTHRWLFRILIEAKFYSTAALLLKKLSTLYLLPDRSTSELHNKAYILLTNIEDGSKLSKDNQMMLDSL